MFFERDCFARFASVGHASIAVHVTHVQNIGTAVAVHSRYSPCHKRHKADTLHWQSSGAPAEFEHCGAAGPEPAIATFEAGSAFVLAASAATAHSADSIARLAAPTLPKSRPEL